MPLKVILLQSLSEYISENAPMTNLPELLGLHHSNPLGLHPIVIPIFLLLLAVAMHCISHRIYFKQRRDLFPWLYTLLVVTTLSTYYYCFSGDLPQFLDWQLRDKEVSVGWFCQQSIVGLGWSLLGEFLLTYVVYAYLSALMMMVEYVSDFRGMPDKAWHEWEYVIFVMLLGASAAGVADFFAPIAGVWIMIVYQLLMVLITIIKLVVDIARSRNVGRSLFAAISFFIGIEAVTMLVVECIEGYIYIFLPVVIVFSIASTRYRKKQEK